MSLRKQEHDWLAMVETPTIKLYTCQRCGLFRLETINSRFFLVEWSPQFSQCRVLPFAPAPGETTAH